VTVRLVGIGAPSGDPDAWSDVGFDVHGDAIGVANGAVLLGATGLVVAGADDLPAELEGVPLGAGEVRAGAEHPNGAFELDHLVLLTDSLERTSARIEETLGLECRRIRETSEVRQAFHRFDDEPEARGCILELVETDRVEGASLMGAVFNVRDLDSMAARYGADLVSPPKPAVQPGRFIATVRRAAGLPMPVALMTPGR
jgi:hypothetical protein